MKEKYNGIVVWFSNKLNYGFICWDKNGEQQKDLFVHFSDIDHEGYKILYKNQKVSFELGLNHKDVLKAVKVKLLDK